MTRHPLRLSFIAIVPGLVRTANKSMRVCIPCLNKYSVYRPSKILRFKAQKFQFQIFRIWFFGGFFWIFFYFFFTETGRINSVLRGCEPQLVTGDCIYSNPNNDCFKFCYSENCNNEINPWHHDNPWLHDNHNGCSYNVASGFLAVAVPLIIFFTP